MKEFSEINGGKRSKFPADQLVDKAMETIVANAFKFRKEQGLQRNEEETMSGEPKRQVFFPCLKIDSFQLQYFNLTPSFVTRKRKPDGCPVSVNSDVNSLSVDSKRLSQRKESSIQCNSFKDTTATYPLGKSDGNAMLVKKQHQKVQVVSPIPDFMAKNFPLDFPKGFTGPASPVISAQPKKGRMEPYNSATKTVQCPQEKGAQHEKYSSNVDDEGLEEEPVKNSMFWMYRSFPHIA